jgi:hypothetical protein
MVDGVEQTGSFATDADSSTWQHVTFDMTQPYYTWNSGWQSSNLGPATSIIKLQWGQNTNLLMDDISTTGVPEPTVLSLIGFAGLALKFRRRA